MDLMMKAKKPEIKIEYFGQQSRFFEFFEKIIDNLLNGNGVYAETNSGSNVNIFMYAKKGYKVITNDVSEYSFSVANAIMSDKLPEKSDCKYDWLQQHSDSYIKRAAVFASVVQLYGYNAKIPEKLTIKLENKIIEYINYFEKINKQNIRLYNAFNDDLYCYFKKLKKEKIKVDVMFMDFAWPWRDGSKTKEYDTTCNVYNNIFEKSTNNKIEIWDKDNVIDNVIRAVKEAKKVSRYVLLSNQSSNYPTPEILEVALLKNGVFYEERHTMLTDAEYEDNLGKATFFREYLYIIKGNLNEN